MKTKKRYVLCGLSTRGIYHLAHPLLGLNREGGPDFSGTSDLAGILDIDRVRVETNPRCRTRAGGGHLTIAIPLTAGLGAH